MRESWTLGLVIATVALVCTTAEAVDPINGYFAQSYPGAKCEPMYGSTNAAYDYQGNIYNSSPSAGVWVVCPIPKPLSNGDVLALQVQKEGSVSCYASRAGYSGTTTYFSPSYSDSSSIVFPNMFISTTYVTQTYCYLSPAGKVRGYYLYWDGQ